MLKALWAQNMVVKLHDPQALAEIEKHYGHREDLIYCTDQYEAVEGAHALCLLTAWKQYWSPNYPRTTQKMQHPLILDGRNIYDPCYVKAQGFAYRGSRAMKHQNKPYPVEDINTAIARLQGLKDHFEQHHLNDLFADDSTRF